MEQKAKKVKEISPVFKTNIITDNKTKGGRVYNSSAYNAYLARKWVDDNKL